MPFAIGKVSWKNGEISPQAVPAPTLLDGRAVTKTARLGGAIGQRDHPSTPISRMSFDLFLTNPPPFQFLFDDVNRLRLHAVSIDRHPVEQIFADGPLDISRHALGIKIQHPRLPPI